MALKGLPRLTISVMDVVSNMGNYALWSDGTNNVQTSSARMFVDLKILQLEFQKRREVGLKLPEIVFAFEDKATDQRCWNRILQQCLLVKNDVVRMFGHFWMMTGHSHWRIDQIIGCFTKAIRALEFGLISEIELIDVLGSVKTDWIEHLQTFVDEIDDIPELSSYFEKVCRLDVMSCLRDTLKRTLCLLFFATFLQNQ